jgi:hypothetical protein
MNFSVVFILLLVYSSFSSSFFIDPQDDIKELRYPKKSFLRVIFEGTENQEPAPDLSDLQYPKQSFLETFLTRTISNFTRILVSLAFIV